MSKFTTPLKLEFLDYQNFKLLEGFEYYRENDKNDVIRVPKDFVTDFASIPRLFWSILPPQGTKKNRYGKAAVLHDFLYDRQRVFSGFHGLSRKEADDIFYEAMRAVKVSKFVAKLFYYSVRLCGKSRFQDV